MTEKQLVNNYMAKHFGHKSFAGYQYIKMMLEYLLHKYFENKYLSTVKITQIHKTLGLSVPYITFSSAVNYFLKAEHIEDKAGDFLVQTIENILEETQNIEITKEEDEF